VSRPRVVGAAAAAAAAVLLPVAAAHAQDADPRLGRRLAAQTCQACHGMDGISKQANAPTIAGHPEDYFIRQVMAYRDGARHDEQMSIVARDLTDEQIRALAACYSAIELEAVRIPGRD
jgi:cytochrome c553